LKSTQGFDLETTIDALADGPASIIGRYDISVPLTTVPRKVPAGVVISDAAISPAIAGMRHLEMCLRPKTTQQYTREPLSLDKLPKIGDNTPLISINGSVLDLPYKMTETTEYGPPCVKIETYFPDTVLKSGGGLVKLLWPFYPEENWTAIKWIYDPDVAFQVARVSEQTILISRIDGAGFYNFTDEQHRPNWYCPECGDDFSTSQCWQLVAGKEQYDLKTKMCTDSVKGKEGKSSNPQAGFRGDLYSILATLPEKLPDHIVLVGPNGSTHLLTVPAAKTKDDKPQPLQLKQYDSVWLEISATELSTDSSGPSKTDSSKKSGFEGPDLSKVVAVEANGKKLAYILQTAKDETTKSEISGSDKTKAGKTKQVKSIKVEITRELTAKPGTVDIALLDSSNKIIGTRQIQIACTTCTEKGDK